MLHETNNLDFYSFIFIKRLYVTFYLSNTFGSTYEHQKYIRLKNTWNTCSKFVNYTLNYKFNIIRMTCVTN